MIPRSFKKYVAKSGMEIHFFDSGIVATQIGLKNLDIEISDPETIESAVTGLFSELREGIRVKFISESQYNFDPLQVDFKRKFEVEDIGSLKHSASAIFEKEVPSWRSLAGSVFKNGLKDRFLDDYMEEFASEIDLECLKNLGIETSFEPCDLTQSQKKYVSVAEGLRIDSKYCGVLKLEKLGNYETNLMDLCLLRETFPEDYKIVLSAKRIGEKETRFILGNKSKREESGQDLKSHQKYLEAQKATEEVDHKGKKLLTFEFTIILKFATEEALIERSFEIKNNLKKLGEFRLENKGAFFSFLPTLPGAKPHIEHKELADRIPSFFPLCVRGKETLKIPSPRSFVFHRVDHSLDQVDLFDTGYDNFSGIVIGRPGRGKSVFVNTLQQSIIDDPKTRIILVDVKGSHTNTVLNLGGDVHRISSENSTAISPFNFLRNKPSKEIIEIVVDFLEKLILEDQERSLLRSEQALLEEALMTYVSSSPSNPSIDDFARQTKNIPRADSLKRWQKGGIYEDVFSLYGSGNPKSRIQYFDFTNVVTAQKGGVGSAIMSAIMAHYNYQLLSKETDERIVFIADETPFFVRSCFTSFNLLMKNVRKLNGSLLLIAQNLSDLVIDGNTALIDLTEFRVFFSKDGGNADFDRVSGLSEHGIQTLETLGTVNGKFSLFIVLDKYGERIGKLILTRDEYFRASTRANDRSLIENLCKAFNTDDENTVIEIVADIERRFDGFL